MKNLKVGDKVKIKQDLVLGEFYNHCGYHAPMEKYAGKVATITTVFHDSETEVIYKLDIDKGKWFWDSEMLISAEGDESYNKEGRMSILNHKDKTFSGEVVKEMFCNPRAVVLTDATIQLINEEKKKLQEESVRLAKAVCEYEEIVHNLEQDLHKMTQERDSYKDICHEISERFNSLVDKYNELADEYDELVDEYNELVDEYNNLI